MRYSVLGVCGGNGAVLYPFRDNLVGNVELRSAFKTPEDIQWKVNFKAPLFNKSPLYWEMSENISKKPTAIIGHPDCGHSSVLAYSRGKKLSDPLKNHSLNLFISSVNMIRPKIFLMENLPALLKTYPEDHLNSALPDYNLKFLQGSVSKWGNSQVSRKRLVVIGLLKTENPDILDVFKFPKQKNIKLKTFSQLEQPKICPKTASGHVRLAKSTNIAIFGGKKMTLGEIKEAWQSFPETQKRFPANKPRMKYAPGVYRNLKDSYPLTVRKGNREFDNYGNVLTPRQRARIQGIPDSFHIVYQEDKPIFWITKGNITVTKCFPYEIALWFKYKLEKIINLNLLTP